MTRFFGTAKIFVLCLGVLVGLSSCCYNGQGCKFSDSSAQDASLSGGSVNDPNASPYFAAASSAFRNNCVQCHGEFGNYTEAQWVTSGYVAPGQPGSSSVYLRIRGNGVGGVQNMPPGTTMSANEISAINQWITHLSSGAGGSGGGGGGGPNAAARTTAALAALQRITGSGNSCYSCHNVTRPAASAAYSGATVPAFGTFTTDNQFVTSGLVSPGIASSNSWLYRALRGHGDIATMPKSEATIMSNADATAIDTWITQMGNP